LRWREIKRGISWHTYSRGISWFSSFLPLSELAVKRFIDPAAALIVGIALFFLFRPLGLFLILSAVCLFLFETIDYQKQIDRMLDQLDNLVESEVVSENVEYFQSGGVAGARTVEETAGIPTGTDPDLAAAIERRRARSRKSQQTQKPPPSPPPLADSYSTQSPQNQQGYQQQEQTISEPSPNLQRRGTLPPDNLIITDSSQPSHPPPSQQAAPSQAAATQAQDIQSQQGIPIIKSLDDPAFTALPSGAQFVTPDGKTRWKK
jgi:hypothetical protein